MQHSGFALKSSIKIGNAQIIIEQHKYTHKYLTESSIKRIKSVNKCLNYESTNIYT